MPEEIRPWQIVVPFWKVPRVGGAFTYVSHNRMTLAERAAGSPRCSCFRSWIPKQVACMILTAHDNALRGITNSLWLCMIGVYVYKKALWIKGVGGYDTDIKLCSLKALSDMAGCKVENLLVSILFDMYLVLERG